MVQAVKLAAQQAQDLVRQLTDLTQRMIRRHSLLQAHIAEHLVLYSFVSTHISTDARTLKKDLNTETFFNKFVELFTLPFVHILCLTADERLVHFHQPGERSNTQMLQDEPQSLQHEPCGLLGNAKIPVDLVAGYAILAVHEQPEVGSHLHRDSGESSKIVPTLTENCLRHL